jgi:hypothetical protein
MAKARQARRIAFTWAQILGAAAGIKAVNAFYAIDPLTFRWRASVRESLRNGFSEWARSAFLDRMAERDNCPRGYEHWYYIAFDLAVCIRISELDRG